MFVLAAGTTDGLLSHHSGPPYPKNIQCYWEIPRVVSYTLEFGIFVMLGLSGKWGAVCHLVAVIRYLFIVDTLGSADGVLVSLFQG